MSCDSTLAGFPCARTDTHDWHTVELAWRTENDDTHGYIGKHRRNEDASDNRGTDSGTPVSVATTNRGLPAMGDG